MRFSTASSSGVDGVVLPLRHEQLQRPIWGSSFSTSLNIWCGTLLGGKHVGISRAQNKLQIMEDTRFDEQDIRERLWKKYD